MLILSRKADEKIVIGEEVEVTILSIRGSQVKLGIEAPKDVHVFREEIREDFNEKHAANEAVGFERLKRQSAEARHMGSPGGENNRSV